MKLLIQNTGRILCIGLVASLVAGCGGSLPAIADRAESSFWSNKTTATDSASQATEQADPVAAPAQKSYNAGKSAPTKTMVVDDFSIRPMLGNHSVAAINSAIGRYQQIVDNGGWPIVPGGRVLTQKSKGKRVALLNQRLAVEGYLSQEAAFGANGTVFGKETQLALRRFQVNNGLYAHGKLDEATRRSLNVPANQRLATLQANKPRVEEYTRKLKDRYIVVNIPATQLDSVFLGAVHSRHNVIVGKPDRPSPVLVSKVSELNFNPYWHAPQSIVEKDIIPKMRKNLNILKEQNIKVYDGYGGPEVDPKTVDWNTADPARYHFRQEPGGGNAMASVKINFRNKYSVYMHDTPTKQQFTQGDRYFSSGCVRVDKVHILTSWILNGQDGWDKQRIAQTVKSGERLDVEVQNPPEVIWAYLTAWADDNGQVHFRNDIYNLDGTGFISGQPEAIGGDTDDKA